MIFLDIRNFFSFKSSAERLCMWRLSRKQRNSAISDDYAHKHWIFQVFFFQDNALYTRITQINMMLLRECSRGSMLLADRRLRSYCKRPS